MSVRASFIKKMYLAKVYTIADVALFVNHGKLPITEAEFEEITGQTYADYIASVTPASSEETPAS